jgi:hypothetical protein
LKGTALLSIEQSNEISSSENHIGVAQVKLAELADMLVRHGGVVSPGSKINKFLQTPNKSFAGTRSKSLAVCIRRACERASEEEGRTFPVSVYRSVKTLSGKLRAEIVGRPVPLAAQTPAFQKGLDALADMQCQVTKGASKKGKPWRRNLISAVAMEMMLAFQDIHISAIAEILLYCDEDSTERCVRNVLTPERLQIIRIEADEYRQSQQQSERIGQLLMSQYAIPQTPKDTRTDGDRLHQIMDIARGMHDAEPANELIAAVQSIIDTYGIV